MSIKQILRDALCVRGFQEVQSEENVHLLVACASANV